MPAAKLIPVIIIGAVVLLFGVFLFMPGLRPGFVQGWFNQAKGFSKAKTPEEALEKLKLAIENRDYEAAKLYLTGSYAEYFERCYKDAYELAKAIDDLKYIMKETGISTDEVDVMLFWLDPFPAFRYTYSPGKSEGEGGGTVRIHWEEDKKRLSKAEVASHILLDNYRKVKPLMLHSLLPSGVLVPVLTGKLKEENGVWKVELPVETGSGANKRHMTDCVEALRKSGKNYSNALIAMKTNLKNDPDVKVKATFEREFRQKLFDSN